MSGFHFLILLAIAIITTIRPTLGAEIDAGDFIPAKGINPVTKDPWSDNCKGRVKIIDDHSITLEGFDMLPSPWGQVIAFANDPYEGKYPDLPPGVDPTKDVRPIDAVFVKEGVPPDSNKCYSFTDGEADYKGTLKVKAAYGNIVNGTKFIGIYCLRFNILFCWVSVAGKLDGIAGGDPATLPKCSDKYKECWKEGGEKNPKCAARPVDKVAGGAALPMSSKWSPFLTIGLVVVMLTFPCLTSGSPQQKL